MSDAIPNEPLPRMPWVASQQYSMRFILSQDNEILWRCDFVPMPILKAMVEAANKSGSNAAARDSLVIAFAQGAQWWEYHRTGATMWPSDRDQAEGEAETKLANGSLGVCPS